MRILITGATGLVGASVCARLRGEHEVWGLSRKAAGQPGEIEQDLESLAPWSPWPSLDVVVHAAGRVGGALDPAAYDVNVSGTAGALERALAAGARRFILVSSGAVYGAHPSASTEETALNPEGPYAESKAAAERLLVSARGRVATHCLRLFFPYGVGQRRERLIPGLIARVAAGQPVKLNNANGEPQLNPVHVTDVAELVARLVVKGGPAVLNLAGSEVVSVRDLAEQIGARLGRAPSFAPGSEPAGRNYTGDSSLAKRALGFEPGLTLAQGLALMVSDRGAAG